jgi:poly-gamma-glutamate capsule biosynthesis protein CapA/YwtB (metallophosphatase superfamily)
MHRYASSFFIVIVLIFLSTLLCAQKPSDSTSKDTLVIVGVGDVMLGTIIPSRTYLPTGEDCSKEFQNVKDIISKADVAMCNLEGVFTDTPNGHKPCKGDNCWTFGMPTKFAKCLADAGFDLINNANNHCKDFGEAGKKSTAKALDSAGLHYAGWLTNPYTIFIKDSIKYGFCGFSPESGNCDIHNYVAAAKIVHYLDSVCDVVIVSFHSGAEGPEHQHVTRKDEMFMGYNRGNVYDFAHKMIDAGADVIFGHGPHVTRAVEVYKDRFIAYSMGNFCTYSRVSIAGVCGLAPIMQLSTDKKGKFLKANIISTYQMRFQPPLIDTSKRVLKVIQTLTKTDFPEVKINISDEGVVTEAP